MSIQPGPALVVLLLAASSAAANGLALKNDAELHGAAAVGKEGPLFVMADRIESNAPNIIEASGRVEARQAGQAFFSDWLRYDTVLNAVEARGQVRLEQPALLVAGDSLLRNLDENGVPIPGEEATLAAAYRFLRPRIVSESDLTRLVRTLLRLRPLRCMLGRRSFRRSRRSQRPEVPAAWNP